MTNKEPSPNNNYLAAHAELLLSSFFRITGKTLLECDAEEKYAQLYHSPFCVLSHNTASDPIFNYGNKTAQTLFEMNWHELTRLPSRLSAETITQEERDTLLAQVTTHDFIDNYTGVRISATGKRFFIEDAVVWNLKDENNNHHGQAAVIYQWSPL